MYDTRKQYRVGVPERMIYDPWITGTEVKVWCLIASRTLDLEYEHYRAQEIADWVGISYWTAHRSVNRLIKAGYLTKVGDTQNIKTLKIITK